MGNSPSRIQRKARQTGEEPPPSFHLISFEHGQDAWAPVTFVCEVQKGKPIGTAPSLWSSLPLLSLLNPVNPSLCATESYHTYEQMAVSLRTASVEETCCPE